MSRNAGRAVVASCTLVVVVGVGVIYTAFLGDRVAAQAIPDVGKFRAGSELGEERAGFSGRHRLFLFVTPSSPEWDALTSCLQSPEVVGKMDNFAGILIDPTSERNVEPILRKRDGLQVVIRGLNGEFFGGLRSGFTCDDLATLLDSVNAFAPFTEKSPIYSMLLDSAEPINALKRQGKVDVAAKFVELLAEFEGSDSESVKRAETELRK